MFSGYEMNEFIIILYKQIINEIVVKYKNSPNIKQLCYAKDVLDENRNYNIEERYLPLSSVTCSIPKKSFKHS